MPREHESLLDFSYFDLKVELDLALYLIIAVVVNDVNSLFGESHRAAAVVCGVAVLHGCADYRAREAERIVRSAGSLDEKLVQMSREHYRRVYFLEFLRPSGISLLLDVKRGTNLVHERMMADYKPYLGIFIFAVRYHPVYKCVLLVAESLAAYRMTVLGA